MYQFVLAIVVASEWEKVGLHFQEFPYAQGAGNRERRSIIKRVRGKAREYIPQIDATRTPRCDAQARLATKTPTSARNSPTGQRVATWPDSGPFTRRMAEWPNGVGSGVFNFSHSGVISQFLAYPFPFHDWLP